MNTMNTIIIIGLLAWVIWEGIKIKVIIPNMLDTVENIITVKLAYYNRDITEDVNIPDGKFVESDTKS